MGQQIAPTDSYTCLSYERFSNIASPVGFSPANLLIKGQPCQEVLIVVENAPIRFTLVSNIVPNVSGVGVKMSDGNSYVIKGTETIQNFKMIGAAIGNGAVVHCHYFF
jgi:hypothetical protein